MTACRNGSDHCASFILVGVFLGVVKNAGRYSEKKNAGFLKIIWIKPGVIRGSLWIWFVDPEKEPEWDLVRPGIQV